MIGGLLKAVVGSRNDRLLRRFSSRVKRINAMEEGVMALSDSDLAGKTPEFRRRLAEGATPDSLLEEAFACVREAARRKLGMRHFDVQLVGGMALFDGKVTEMRTGEGKTLVATLPVYLAALEGKGVHVVTVNDYLAMRDARWMSGAYLALGMSVGVNIPGLGFEQKRASYGADITYGTNNEFGFDYLRDNMRHRDGHKVQRELNYAIVDEVDSILIDEARTPLIISGESADRISMYRAVDEVAKDFVAQKGKMLDAGPTEDFEPGDFTLELKTRHVHLTEEGYEKAEQMFGERGLLQEGGLYDTSNLQLLHHLTAALRARNLYERDKEYVVQDGKVVIVDEFTGRLMPGRRWGEGLHQAVEAKEGAEIEKESLTLASITFQNYFRLYDKLAGMTGTADTEAAEFQQIYGLETTIVPTHRKMVRDDAIDKIYQTRGAKLRAVVADLHESHGKGQPVLVGTASIESSEELSGLLKKEGLPHSVLNAKEHAREASIVAEAGLPGAITIATNMAGRGTDIVLGGKEPDAAQLGEEMPEEERAAAMGRLEAEWRERHDRVIEAGGLRIIGTERHESRRIDNQLRGRSGRQGDPGSSIFYLSFEDPLLKIFAADRVSKIMKRLQIEEDEAIEARMVSRVIENAQRKVEAQNFDARKQLLEYDDIANDQRRIIYEQREQIMGAKDIGEITRDFRSATLESFVDEFVPPGAPEEDWRIEEMEKALLGDFRLAIAAREWLKEDPDMGRERLAAKVVEAGEKVMEEKLAGVDPKQFEGFERMLVLNVVDVHWRQHLSALEQLRQTIHLRGFAHKNPKQEYKRESLDMFNKMVERMRSETARVLLCLQVREDQSAAHVEKAEPSNVRYEHEQGSALGQGSQGAAQQPAGPAAPAPAAAPQAAPRAQRKAPPRKAAPAKRAQPKIGRNEPCPCGSGKKFKNCCGTNL